MTNGSGREYTGRSSIPFTFCYTCAPSPAFLLSMPTLLKTILLLSVSNVFMTFAWYAHLKELNNKPWLIAALASWGIALFEYLFQVPGNRIGYTEYNIGELKILQEAITLTIFVPFAIFYLKQPLRMDYIWAGLCILGAVYFAFRGHVPAN